VCRKARAVAASRTHDWCVERRVQLLHRLSWSIQGFQGFDGFGSWAGAHLRFHVSEQAEDDGVDAQYLHAVR
jgi:hypothetical protein